MRGSREGVVGVRTPPPLEFAKLNIADITGNEKINYFPYMCIGISGSAPDISLMEKFPEIQLYHLILY